MVSAKVTIYHNPRCRRSRAGLERLRETGAEIEIRDYLTTPFTTKEMEDLLMRLNKKPSEIVRTGEKEYITRFRGRSFSDEEWIRILLDHPRLIRRPIVVKGLRAVVAEDPDEIGKLF
jgi:arsenate reductase (glutaredoxin)